MRFILITSFFVFVFISSLFAGGDMGIDFSWENMKTVNGKANECVITFGKNSYISNDEFRAFYDNGVLTRFDSDTGTRTFEYEDNRITRIKNGYLNENGETNIYGTTFYNYDKNGKLLSITELDFEDNVISEQKNIVYDNTENLIVRLTDTEGNIYRKDTYNKDLYLVESVVYTEDTIKLSENKKTVETKTNIKYDKNNNVLEKVISIMTPSEKDMPAKIVQSFEYEFDKSGNKISQKTKVVPADNLDGYYYLLLPDIKFTYSFTEENKTTVTEKKDNLKTVKVEWNGTWYEAEVLKEENGKYYIHYTGYDSSWDEWVTKDRIKLK